MALDVAEGTEETVAGQPPPSANQITDINGMRRPFAPVGGPQIPGSPGVPAQRFIPAAIPRPQAASSGSDSPEFQRQTDAWQMEVIKHAKNVQEAEKDLASARKMLGVLDADRRIRAGESPDQAIFKNLHLLTTPGSAAARMAQPVPKPYGTEIMAGTNRIPAIITPQVGGGQHTQIVPRSAMPQPAFTPSVRELEPGLRVAELSKGRYTPLKEGGPEKLSDADKIRAHSLYTELGQIRKKKLDETARGGAAIFGGGPRKDVLKELADREKEITSELKQFGSEQAQAKSRKRLKWNAHKADFEAASAEEE